MKKSRVISFKVEIFTYFSPIISSKLTAYNDQMKGFGNCRGWGSICIIGSGCIVRVYHARDAANRHFIFNHEALHFLFL